jgi:hypothetical protein
MFACDFLVVNPEFTKYSGNFHNHFIEAAKVNLIIL